VPEAARVNKHAPERLPWLMVFLSVALSVSALAVGGLLYLLPAAVGRVLLDDTWQPARGVVFFLALALAASSANTGAMTGLRALGDSRRMFRTRLVAAPMILIGVTVGASVAGAPGAALGNAASTCLTDVVWWRSFRASFKERTGTRLPRRGSDRTPQRLQIADGEPALLDGSSPFEER
jgi:hypothetical protein